MTDTSLTLADELRSFYKQNINAGADNLGSSFPQLKLIQKDPEEFDTADGKHSAKKGQFYLTSNKTCYDDPEVSFLYFDSGYLPVPNPENDPAKEGKTQYTTVLVGYLHEAKESFMMYVKSTSLASLFAWQKTVTTEMKLYGCPMFAIINKLSFEKREKGPQKWLSIVFSTTGKVVTEIELAQMLNDSVDKAKTGVSVALRKANQEEVADVPNLETVQIAAPSEVADDINF